jgi:hypothetical protein
MESELKRILASGQVPADLSITYDDMHGLWGGSILTVRGDGWLERQTRPRGAPMSASSKKQIGEQELLEVVRLLVELSAWKQRTLATPPIPDESRAQLTISLKGNTSQVWERFNEMPANDRLIRIKHWIENRFAHFRDFGDDPRNASGI